MTRNYSLVQQKEGQLAVCLAAFYFTKLSPMSGSLLLGHSLFLFLASFVNVPFCLFASVVSVNVTSMDASEPGYVACSPGSGLTLAPLTTCSGNVCYLVW